jgi:DNA mismatch endonuclease (patch repair protein)
MVDVVDKITRSKMMAGIRGKDTKPEIALRRALHREGLRFRLHASRLPGRPDLVFPKHHAAIQVHGCFWHRHKDCVFCTIPASNKKFWKSKFDETVVRDEEKLKALRKLGWRVAVVWECSVKECGAEAIGQRIVAWLRSDRSFKEIAGRSRRTAPRRKSKKKG